MWWRPFGRLSKCDIRFPKCGFEIIGGMRSEYFRRGELCSPVFLRHVFRANAVRPYDNMFPQRFSDERCRVTIKRQGQVPALRSMP